MPAAVLAALEVSERLKDYGAYAGVASILGLAVLSLLYFGQARELKRLREWAGREPERAAEREAVVSANAQRVAPQPQPQRPAQAQPAPAAASAAAAGAAAAPAGAPRPRAAVPATAAGSATQVIKPGEVPGAAAPPAVPGGPGGDPPKSPAPAAPAAPVPANGSDAPEGDDTGEWTGEEDVVPAAPAADADAAAGTPAPPRPRTVPLPSQRAAGAAGPGGTGPRTPAGVAGARRAGEPGEEGRPGGRRIAAIAGAVVGALLIAVLLVTVVFGGSDDAAKPGNTFAAETETVDLPRPGTTSTPGAAAPGGVARSEVVVAVLNGTTSNGLAREAMDKIAGEGYREGTTDNAPDRTLTVTKIAFAEGFRKAAQDVARLIGVQAANVVELDRSTQVVAGEDAKVVVTLGADKA